MDISSSGELAASDNPNNARRKKSGHPVQTVESAHGIPAQGDEKTAVKVGHTSTVRDRDGTVFIHIDCIQIVVDADVVHQLNLNPQEVKNYMVSQVDALEGEIEEKMVTMAEKEHEEKNEKKESDNL